MIKKIDFTTRICDSEGEPIEGTERDMSVLYNDMVISEEETRYLLNSGGIEYDKRAIVTSPEQAAILIGEAGSVENEIQKAVEKVEESLSSLENKKGYINRERYQQLVNSKNHLLVTLDILRRISDGKNL